MRAERVIVLVISTKLIPYVFRNTTCELEPSCLSFHNTDGELITAEGQSGAATQDNLLTRICGRSIKIT